MKRASRRAVSSPPPARLLATMAAIGLAALPSPLAADEGALSLSGSATCAFSTWEDRGSALAPALSAAAYAGSAAFELRAEAPSRAEGLSRCAFEGSVSIDAVTGESSFAARELWAEWRPVSAIALRAGRQRFGYGSGFGWNPANDLDPKRDASDPTAVRAGADAAQLRFEAGDAAGFPLSLSFVGILPEFETGTTLADARLGAQLYSLIGCLELMLMGSASSVGDEDEAWLAGGWATLPIGSLVLGLEASARRRSDLYRPDSSGQRVADRAVHGAAVATATLRSGDFLVVAEGYWDEAAYTRDELAAMLSSTPAELASWAEALLSAGSVGALHALGRVTWASGDWSASCGALVDAETGAFVASAEAAAAVQGRATIKAKAAIPGGVGLLSDDELGLSGRGWILQASVVLNF